MNVMGVMLGVINDLLVKRVCKFNSDWPESSKITEWLAITGVYWEWSRWFFKCAS